MKSASSKNGEHSQFKVTLGLDFIPWVRNVIVLAGATIAQGEVSP
jgi:hypothetical protein